MFVSSLYTGAISDKEITRCSGILDLVEAGDSVMADKGFDIEDLLRKKNVSLNLPPFLESRSQFSAAEVQQTKMIAKVRIHVERAIRRIKEYHIFDSDVPLSMLGSINQLYTVVCLLTYKKSCYLVLVFALNVNKYSLQLQHLFFVLINNLLTNHSSIKCSDIKSIKVGLGV